MITQNSMDAYRSISLNKKQQVIYNSLSVSISSNESLAERLHLPSNSVTPRVLELRNMGLVKKMYDEKGKSGRYQSVWGVVQ